MTKETAVIKGDPINRIDEVGVLGPRFSYSDYVGSQIAKRVICYPTFKKLLEALDGGEITHVIIPIENTTVGGVQGVNALLQRQTAIQIVGEYRLPIKHALLAGKWMRDISKVQIVVSHQQALDQCSHIIKQNGWEEKSAPSTSAAVQEVANNTQHMAAIGPINNISGKIISLKENIQDLKGNLTRFVLLKKISGYECPTGNWDRAYLSISALDGAYKSRTVVQDTIGKFSKYGATIRRITSTAYDRKYSTLLEIYYTENYTGLLKFLEKQSSLRFYRLGRCKLRELTPPSRPEI